MRVQALVPEATIEAFDMCIVGRLARTGEVQRHPVDVSPMVQGFRDEFGSIIHPDIHRGRIPPVDALQKHRQLGRREAHLARRCRRPREPALFQALGEQAVPPDDLQKIPTPAPEYEQMPRKGAALQNLFRLRRQGVEAATHVRHPRR